MKRFKTPSARNVMLGLLLVPVVASTIYYSLVAQDRFASTTVVTVTDTSAGGSGGAAGLLAAMGGGWRHTPTPCISKAISSLWICS